MLDHDARNCLASQVVLMRLFERGGGAFSSFRAYRQKGLVPFPFLIHTRLLTPEVFNNIFLFDYAHYQVG